LRAWKISTKWIFVSLSNRLPCFFIAKFAALTTALSSIAILLYHPTIGPCFEQHPNVKKTNIKTIIDIKDFILTSIF
jgi:hypothetical protein